MSYISNIYFPIMITVIAAIIFPLFIRSFFDEGWLRFMVVGISCVFSVGICASFLGLTSHERTIMINMVRRVIRNSIGKD
jgi:hypothetical protein